MDLNELALATETIESHPDWERYGHLNWPRDDLTNFEF